MIFDFIADLFKSESDDMPKSHFGRYCDAYKTVGQRIHWNKAEEFFKKGEYLNSYENLFQYLLDEKEQNVAFEREGDGIEFHIYQGSKRMTGFADSKHFKVFAKVARYESLDVAIMRKLLERNYELRYSSFCLSENQEIAVRFETSSLDGSPEKLYAALKEVALYADKEDDLLLNEFPILKPVENQHLQAFSTEEIGIKANFLRKWIKQCCAILEGMKVETGRLPASYLLLSLAYKIDYLIVPQGNIMGVLENVHRTCGVSPSAEIDRHQITALKKEFQSILSLNDQEIAKELYRVTATFGVSPVTEQAVIANEILEQIPVVRMYHDHQEEELAIIHLEYIALRIFFRYGINRPTRELLDLVVEMLNSDYWAALGLRANLISEEGVLYKSNIQRRIQYIVKKAKQKYPAFSIEASHLHYSDKIDFCESLLQQIRKLNFNVAS